MTTEQILHKIHREEAGNIIAVLTKIFGIVNLQLAENILQDVFIGAIEKWGNKIPKNPKKWIYNTIKKKVSTAINQKKYQQEYQYKTTYLPTSNWTNKSEITDFFSQKEMNENQLKMMFTCCNPEINNDSQAALILKILCGFNTHEIAKIHLIDEDIINKRLIQARAKLTETKSVFETSGGNKIHQRLNVVLTSIYLLFNKGYCDNSVDKTIRFELCLESIRLTEIIIESDLIKNKGETHALLSLMNFNASQFIARISKDHQIITMEHQDRSKWDKNLINKGVLHLNNAITCNQVSKYLILAAISANHCSAPAFKSTNWQQILALYDQLLLIDNTPIVYLNRALTISMVNGKQKAIELMEVLKKEKKLASYHPLLLALGNLYQKTNQKKLAIKEYKAAFSLTKVDSEKKWILSKIEKCS
jgi:RNA polymerase sigma-70 factor (ECF subfamily)